MNGALSAREKQCLYWAAKDKTLTETASKLHISPETVKWHRKVLLKKLGCQTITGALISTIDCRIRAIDLEKLIQ